MDKAKLLKKAYQAQELAYAPYSNFQVGAAILTESGKVFTGCNIENASYSATVCAERTALFKAVSEGEQDFKALAISAKTTPTLPCGVCRQVLFEFAPEIKIIYEDEGEIKDISLTSLFPNPFILKENSK